jgi:hypothetical protein
MYMFLTYYNKDMIFWWLLANANVFNGVSQQILLRFTRGGRSVYSVISVRSIRCLGVSGFRKVRTEVIGTEPE